MCLRLRHTPLKVQKMGVYYLLRLSDYGSSNYRSMQVVTAQSIRQALQQLNFEQVTNWGLIDLKMIYMLGLGLASALGRIHGVKNN